MTASSTSLQSLIPSAWQPALATAVRQPWFAALDQFVREERAAHAVFPSPEQTFAALAHTPLEVVKVVLLGQDPYPTRGNAMGLSFSVPRGQKVPASLRNIYKVLESDAGVAAPKHGDLTAWADAGVLLLNAVLTVREGEAGSHQKRGWEQLTRAVLEAVDGLPRRVVFLSLGKHAQAATAFVNRERHAVVETPHPSPLVIGNPFGKTRPFSDVNRLLEAGGVAPVDWRLPA